MKLERYLLVILLAMTSSVHGDLRVLFGDKPCAPPINCPFVPKDQVISQSSQCCHNLTKTFYCSWKDGGLTKFLQILKSWNCTDELARECESRTFDWTDFTDAVYLTFCDPEAFRRKCSDRVASAVGMQWRDAINSVDPLKLKDDDLLDPCVQAAVYMNDGSRFVEFLEIDLNKCDMVWGGFDETSLIGRKLSLLKLLPVRCKVMIYIGIVILIFLTIFGFIVNFLVVWIIYITSTLRHSQYVYRVSIAVSDCLHSVFICPLMLSHYFTHIDFLQNFKEVSLPDGNSSALVIDKLELFDQQYVDTVGVFTHCFIVVSCYTLTVGTADRLYAVMYPLRYKKRWSADYAARAVAAVWIVSILTALIPLFTKPHLKFSISSQVVVRFVGEYASLIYSLLLIVPAILLWGLSIMTFVSIKRSGRRFKKNKTQKNSQEIRLALTLLLMVGCFSLSFLPALGSFIYMIVNGERLSLDNPTRIDLDYIRWYLVYRWAAFLLFTLNTIWNFLIYNARDKQFRTAVFRYLAKLKMAMGLQSLRRRLKSWSSISDPSNLKDKKTSDEEKDCK